MIQIIGTNKCKETQKAIRYFKEHRYEFQFVDLKERTLSEKEWDSIFSSNDAELCIDKILICPRLVKNLIFKRDLRIYL